MYVRIEKEGSITTVIMDRPNKRNAVDRFMAEELREAFLEFEADDEQCGSPLGRPWRILRRRRFEFHE